MADGFESRAQEVIRFRLDLAPVLRRLQAAPALVAEELDRLAQEIATLLERLASEETPEGATGQLRGTAFAEVRGVPARQVILEWPAPYAEYALRGRRPGKMPPPEALKSWVEKVLGISGDQAVRAVAFLVARKIGRRGTPGDPFLYRVQTRAEPLAANLAAEAGGRIAGRLGGA